MGTANHRTIGYNKPSTVHSTSRRHFGDASTHTILTLFTDVLVLLPVLVLIALFCNATALFPERGHFESLFQSVKAGVNYGDPLPFVGFQPWRQSLIVSAYAQNVVDTVPPPSAYLVADLYLSLQLSQTGSVVYVLSANKSEAERPRSPAPSVSQVLASPIPLLWENIRQRAQVIRVHITSSAISSSSRWNATQIAMETTRTVWSLNSTNGTNSGSDVASLYTEGPRITDLSYFLGQEGLEEGFTPDRAFPQGNPFRVACPNNNNSSSPQQITSGDSSLSQEVSADSQRGILRSSSFSVAGPRRLIRSDPSIYDQSASNVNASGVTDNSCENTTVLMIVIGPKHNFRLWHLAATGSLRIPLRWIDNVQRYITTTTDDDGTSTSSTSSSSSSFLTISLSFSTQIPSTIKQNTMFALCCAVGVASVITGGGGWIGLTSLQTLLVSVGGPNHCTEPFTDYYFANVYTILVAPTTLAKQSIESNHALTVGIIVLSILLHVAVATIKKKFSNVSFWSAARSCYFPMPFLIAVTYLWIRLNSETFIGVAGTDQTPLIRVSFALSWLIVICVTVYVWYDALVTGHDGYYVLTQLPTSLEKTTLGAKVKDLGTHQSSSDLLNVKMAEQIMIDDLERSVNVRDDQKPTTRMRHTTHQHHEVELRNIPARAHKSSDELLGGKSERLNNNNTDTGHYDRKRPPAPTKREGGKPRKYNVSSKKSPQASVVPAAAQQHLLKVESLVVRISYGLLGRFAWFIIPEGSWPLTRGYGVCRGLFRDTSCSFAIFTLLFLCVIAAVSNSASCEALYLNSAIVQSIYLLLFLVFLPFRIPLLNLLWVVIKVTEITVNACLYYFLQHNFDGGVTDVIPALATVVTGLNAAFVFYACLVTFSERSARNSEKLKLIISKGVGHGLAAGPHKYFTGDGGHASHLADLDKEPRSDPNFLSLVEHYRSFAAK